MLLYALSLLVSLSPSPAWAEASSASSSTSTAAQELASPQAASEGDRHEIKDAELKSRAGSRSRWSMKFDLEYAGPPVGDIGSLDQPNPDQTVAPTATGLSGLVGTRYRLGPDEALSLNAGLTAEYLFHGPKQSLDVFDPLFFYERSFHLGGVDFLAMTGATFITSKVYKSRGEVGGLDERLYWSYHWSNIPLALGSTLKAQYYFFDRPYRPGPVKKGGDGKVRELSLTFSPVLRYVFSDLFNVHTSLHFNFFHPRGIENPTGISPRLVFQRLGVGYRITKVIYIDPYIQFFPTRFSWSTATLNVATIFSLL